MACESNFPNTVLEWVSYAYQLAGSPQRAVIFGPDAQLAKFLLNSILDVWSGDNRNIFFNNQTLFTITTALTNKQFFTIGPSAIYDVQDNAYNDILSVYYNAGGIDYQIKYMPLKSYDAINFKNIGAYPVYYDFEAHKDYTVLKIFPFPTEGMIIKVNGKQRLSNVTYFQTNTEVANYGVLFLIYELARQLSNFKGWTPQPDFKQTYIDLQRKFVASNKQDLQYELVPAFLPFGSYYGGRLNNG